MLPKLYASAAKSAQIQVICSISATMAVCGSSVIACRGSIWFGELPEPRACEAGAGRAFQRASGGGLALRMRLLPAGAGSCLDVAEDGVQPPCSSQKLSCRWKNALPAGARDGRRGDRWSSGHCMDKKPHRGGACAPAPQRLGNRVRQPASLQEKYATKICLEGGACCACATRRSSVGRRGARPPLEARTGLAR